MFMLNDNFDKIWAGTTLDDVTCSDVINFCKARLLGTHNPHLQDSSFVKLINIQATL